MSLNWREIDAILQELTIADCHIQKIRQPDFSSLVLDLFGQRLRYPLYICLAQNQTRIHRLTRRVKNEVHQNLVDLSRLTAHGREVAELVHHLDVVEAERHQLERRLETLVEVRIGHAGLIDAREVAKSLDDSPDTPRPLLPAFQELLDGVTRLVSGALVAGHPVGRHQLDRQAVE